MTQPTANRLLARVKELREGLGLTQEAFAEKAGLGYKYYQSVEAGRRRDIRLSTIEKLARACGLQLWELLNFDLPVGVVREPDPEPYLVPRRSRSTKGSRPKSSGR